jgi:hypothetical protein
LHDDPTVLRMQRDILSRMSPEERMRIVGDLNRAADAMAEAGIRDRYPEASDREVFLRLAVRKLGYALARTAYPEVEGLEGVRR